MKKSNLLSGTLLLLLIAINITLSTNKELSISSLASIVSMSQAQAAAELKCPTCTEYYLKFGTWTCVNYSGSSTYSADTATTIIIDGVSVTTRVGVSYTSPSKTYSVWECKGFNGDC